MKPKLFQEIHQISGRDETRYELELYHQPRWMRWRAVAYHRVWEKLTWRLLKRVDPWAWKRHRKTCDTNCAIGFRTTDGAVAQLCGYVPPSARQDLRCYEWQHAGREVQCYMPVTELVAQIYGWPVEV